MNPNDLLNKIKELWPKQYVFALWALVVENEAREIEVKEWFGKSHRP